MLDAPIFWFKLQRIPNEFWVSQQLLNPHSAQLLLVFITFFFALCSSHITIESTLLSLPLCHTHIMAPQGMV